jgi:glycosyltransferase involved in cell wall biosynthesis
MSPIEIQTEQPVVGVFALIRDNQPGLEASLRSIQRQNYPNIRLYILLCHTAKKTNERVKALCAELQLEVQQHLEIEREANLASVLNKAAEIADIDFLSLLSPGDVYAEERISTLVKAATERRSGALLTYITPSRPGDRRLNPDNHFYRHYNHALLSDIAGHPCLSYAALYHDVVSTPGNLFVSKEMLLSAGGFRNFRILYAYDLFLRLARLEEPVMIRDRLISAWPEYLNRDNHESDSSREERAEITREHLLSILAKPPQNPFCDVFRQQSFMFAGTPWSRSITDAIDGLLEYREGLDDLGCDHDFSIPEKITSDGDHDITLITHELSLTGAPVIILELATLLQNDGYKVLVLSPTDGPLKRNFSIRNIDVSILPPLHFRHARAEDWLRHHGSRMTPKGFIKWMMGRMLQTVKPLYLKKARERYQSLLRGKILINSVAAWQLVLDCLSNDVRVAWYIHETFDPKWIANEHADRVFRRSIHNGKLRMIFGSKATASYWAKEGYVGDVRYWSGITADRHKRTSIKRNWARPVILNVGSVGARKGTRVLIEAFAIARKSGLIPQDAELCIVGVGNPSGNQEARDIVFRGYREDLHGHVRLVGNIEPSAIDSYYAEATIYVHASYFDCMPIALLTALSWGLPVIATNVDGCPEAISDHVGGLLVPPRNPQMLAEAMGRYFANTELAESLAAAGQKQFRDKLSVEKTYPVLKSWLLAAENSPSKRKQPYPG